MTAPTPTTNPDRMTAEELRAALRSMVERLDSIEEDLASIREGLAAAAAHPAAAQAIPAASGETVVFEAVNLILSYDDAGNPVYKVKGGNYMKFGVRVWPEVLPALGIDPAVLKPGPNPIKIKVTAIMGESGPRKVIGLG